MDLLPGDALRRAGEIWRYRGDRRRFLRKFKGEGWEAGGGEDDVDVSEAIVRTAVEIDNAAMKGCFDMLSMAPGRELELEEKRQG